MYAQDNRNVTGVFSGQCSNVWQKALTEKWKKAKKKYRFQSICECNTAHLCSFHSISSIAYIFHAACVFILDYISRQAIVHVS